MLTVFFLNFFLNWYYVNYCENLFDLFKFIAVIILTGMALIYGYFKLIFFMTYDLPEINAKIEKNHKYD